MKSPCVLRFLAVCLACSFVRDARACPAFCTCYARRAEVVCNDVPLTEYPSKGLLKNTTLLTIQYTNVSSISERHLSATPLLEGLHLYSNHLRDLSPHLLRGVPRLHTLDLTGNKLGELPARVFDHAPLRSLVLKNNLIGRADGAWISGTSNLTWLDMSGNHLSVTPAALLQKLPHLDHLDLSNNRLETIPADSLASLAKLERLNLQNNKLEALNASLFQSMQNLTYLFLTRNQIHNLPPKLFQGLAQLRHLGLENNQLSHVAPGLLDPLASLDEEGLDLRFNPFLCDRDLQYLWAWLQKNKHKVFLPESVTCAKPAALVGRSVLSLKESELNLPS